MCAPGWVVSKPVGNRYKGKLHRSACAVEVEGGKKDGIKAFTIVQLKPYFLPGRKNNSRAE
jgi:hypothetical protein